LTLWSSTGDLELFDPDFPHLLLTVLRSALPLLDRDKFQFLTITFRMLSLWMGPAIRHSSWWRDPIPRKEAWVLSIGPFIQTERKPLCPEDHCPLFFPLQTVKNIVSSWPKRGCSLTPNFSDSWCSPMADTHSY